MSRTEKKVASLVREDDQMRDAIEAVLDATDDGETAVEWEDVKTDLTTGQWGRLIQSGLLDETDGEFIVSNPEGVRDALTEDDAVVSFDDADLADVSWSPYDKIAAFVGFNLILSYGYPPVRDTLGSLIDILLGPLDMVLPFYIVLVILAITTAAVSTLLQYRLIDTEKVGQFKDRVEKIREWQTGERDDMPAEEANAEQMKMLAAQKNMMKEQFRPMAWVLLVTIPIFLWVIWSVRTGQIAEAEETFFLPLLGQVSLVEPVVGPIQGWLIWYFVTSLLASQVIKRVFGLDPMPD